MTDWNATSPGILALSHTQYEIRYEKVGGTWFFNVFWRGECVRPANHTLTMAKSDAMDHMHEMITMGYEV